MAAPIEPPFRADHIGSLLRPRELLEKRAAHDRGESTNEDLKLCEDRLIGEAIAIR